MDELIESYNQTELSKEVKTPISRIKKDTDLYIPVKINTAQARATKRGYSVRYIKKSDVIDYISKKNKVRNNDNLRKKP